MATPLENNASTASEQLAGRGAYRSASFQASGRAVTDARSESQTHRELRDRVLSRKNRCGSKSSDSS
jgi:hypothetical protein